MGGILAIYGLVMVMFPAIRFIIPWMKSDKKDGGRVIVGIISLLLSLAF